MVGGDVVDRGPAQPQGEVGGEEVSRASADTIGAKQLTGHRDVPVASALRTADAYALFSARPSCAP